MVLGIGRVNSRIVSSWARRGNSNGRSLSSFFDHSSSRAQPGQTRGMPSPSSSCLALTETDAEHGHIGFGSDRRDLGCAAQRRATAPLSGAKPICAEAPPVPW